MEILAQTRAKIHLIKQGANMKSLRLNHLLAMSFFLGSLSLTTQAMATKTRSFVPQIPLQPLSALAPYNTNLHLATRCR